MKNKVILVTLLTISLISAPFAEDLTVENDLKNEFYVDYDKARVSDLHTYWNTITPAYYRNTDYGKYGAGFSNLDKFGTSNQYFVDLNPRYKQMYAQVLLNFSKHEQINFPTVQQVYNLYYTTRNGVELSAGYGTKIYSNFSNQKIRTETISVGYYFKEYFVFARPSYDSGQRLLFGQIGLTRYFSDKYNFVRAILNGGTIPDIGDVPPLDTLVKAHQLGINGNGQFSLTTYFYLRLGVGYTKMMYPNFLRRYVTNGTLGFLWRF